MKNIVKCLLLIPGIYLFLSLVGSLIPVNELTPPQEKTGTVFLSSNGIHLDLVFPKELLPALVLNDIPLEESFQYLAFGWGDKNFYLNTPRWEDFKLRYALEAFFLQSETLMHVSKYRNPQKKWIPIAVTEDQLKQLHLQVLSSFKLTTTNKKIILDGRGYGANDYFYEGVGSYSCLKTCNTWANSCLKESGIRACFWTPFDFAVLRLHN